MNAVERLRNGGQPDLADQVEAEIRAAYNKAREQDEQVSRLFDAWVNTHGKPIPWAKAVEIVAIVNRLFYVERDAKRNLVAARNLLLAGIPQWLPIDTAPEDEHILIATSGGHVGTAYWTDEGDGKVWAWGHPEKDHGQYVHPNLKPLGWMPLPKHPEVK